MNSCSSALHKIVGLMVVSMLAACATQGEGEGEGAEVAGMPEPAGAAISLDGGGGGGGQDYEELDGIWGEFGGLTYGGAGATFKGRGSVESCSAGPMGPVLPNRFVVCRCDQLVKDCQDSGCADCSNPRYEACSHTSWFSGIRFSYQNLCNEDELDACEQYCQQACTPSCS